MTATEEGTRRASEADAAGFVSKPFDVNHLLDDVERVLLAPAEGAMSPVVQLSEARSARLERAPLHAASDHPRIRVALNSARRIRLGCMTRRDAEEDCLPRCAASQTRGTSTPPTGLVRVR
jgi:hypothetical protein